MYALLLNHSLLYSMDFIQSMISHIVKQRLVAAISYLATYKQDSQKY